MEIAVIKQRLSHAELEATARATFGEMVKAVVDVRRKILALGGELHADAEAVLLEDGSAQADLWGVNVYPGKPREERVEYSSLINIRPSQGNRSISIQDPQRRAAIREVVDALLE